jgi:hypothetical protein
MTGGSIGRSTSRLPEPRRLLVAGDVHCELGWVVALIDIARSEGCHAIVQLGDLGFLPGFGVGMRFITETASLLRRAGLPLYFLEGNHDDLDALWRTKRRLVSGFVEIDSHLYYLRRGQRFSWSDVSFLAVGGAHSIDRRWRIGTQPLAGTLWWPRETLDDRDLVRASVGGPVDVMFCHDCPAGVTIPGLQTIEPAAENRRRLGTIVDAVRPKLLLHAHYHQRFDGFYRNDDLDLVVPTVGLAHEHTGRKGWIVLDLDELSAAGKQADETGDADEGSDETGARR